jgi:hypothetical protein
MKTPTDTAKAAYDAAGQLVGIRRLPSNPFAKRKENYTGRCPHKTTRWASVPHPRYGKAQPHYRSFVAPTDDCPCGLPQ